MHNIPIQPSSINVVTDGEIVSLTGKVDLPIRDATVVQLEPDSYPENNLYFATLGKRGPQHFLLTSNGRLSFQGIGRRRFPKRLNLSGITYSRAFGLRMTLMGHWRPHSCSFRSPSAYKTDGMVFLGGVMHNINPGRHGVGGGGNGSCLFGVLPMGYRPSEIQLRVAATRDGTTKVAVLPNGECHLASGDGSGFISLEGVRFMHSPDFPILAIPKSREHMKMKLPLSGNWKNYGHSYPELTLSLSFPWVQLVGFIEKRDPHPDVDPGDRMRSMPWQSPSPTSQSLSLPRQSPSLTRPRPSLTRQSPFPMWETVTIIPERCAPPVRLLLGCDSPMVPITISTKGIVRVKSPSGILCVSCIYPVTDHPVAPLVQEDTKK